MHKRRLSAIPTSDGYNAATSPDGPPRERTAIEQERDRLTAEIIADPAHVLIRDLLLDAHERGLDTADPDLISRAITMGREEYAEYEARGVLVATYAALRNSRPEHKEHVPLVYYMRMSSLVKIGTSVHVGKRLSQVGAQGVLALEPGGSHHEHVRHQEFSHLHDHLEWFHMAPELAALIGRLRDDFSREIGQSIEEWLVPWSARRKAKGRTRREIVAI